jgi:hypothetical protein
LKHLTVLVASLLITGLLVGCAGVAGSSLPTPLPAKFMPTAIALTLEAQGVGQVTPTHDVNTPGPLLPTAQTPKNLAGTPTALSDPTSIASVKPPTPTSTPAPSLPLATATSTLAPPFPDAPVQILRVGELSKLNSPVPVSLNMTSRFGKVVRVELYGEDGRLLARHLRTYNKVPWDIAKIGVDLDFGISAAAEAGRLVVSVEDPFGRLIDVNSVNLILISVGQSELNPSTALWQRLIIEEPVPNALIQGGKLYISGRALPNKPDQPLRVMLVGEDGRILGQRLAGVTFTKEGDYGTYLAEVPYTVADLTPALLVIYEEGAPVNDIAHLSSTQVILAP